MLYLLNKDVRTVRWNGEPLHEATSAIVKETMNGDFTLTVKYPISDSGIYQLIQEDMLIKAPTPVLGAQLFRIKKPVEHNDHLEITAYHISDDVMQRSITPVSVTSQSCGMALSRMVQNTKTALGDFSFNSDIQDRRTFNTTETETLYSVLLDGKHSIVGTWEGELVRDNFAMTVKKSRGENRGVVITTHKNLKDYQRTKNSQNVVTRIHAKSTFKPEGAEKETTIRVTVDSPLINSYPYINEKEYENNNAKSVEELQKWAQAKFSNEGIDKVSDAIKIEAYELDGQVVHMGDTVNLKSWKHNADAFKKAIAYEFDALKEEYISLIFDDKAGTGGSRSSGGLSSAADAILGVTESAQEIALEKALQNADLDFDHKAGLLRQEISDGIELARAKAEEVKRELSDNIDQRFNSFNNGPLQEAKRRAEEALRNAGASSLLAQEAKRIGLDSVAKLEEFKRQATSSQTALSGDLDALKRTIANDIRPKQVQVETEIAKQVEALNQTKKELVGVKSAQATYEETTTQRLAELTNLANGKASKSELTQTAEELASRIASVKVGGRNLLRGSKGPFLPDRKPANFDNAILYVGQTSIYMEQGQEYIISAKTDGTFTAHHDGNKESDNVVLWIMDKDVRNYQIVSDLKTGTTGTKITWNKPTGIYHLRVNAYHKEATKSVWDVKIEKGNVATDWSPALEDIEGQISTVESNFRQRADALDAGVSRLTEGLRTKADISVLNVTAENIRQSVKSLETSTQNKLDQKLSLAEFEVQAGSIRQEILNATKDKADKTLVVAEAGKIREEFSKMKVGGRNYAEDYDFSRSLWQYSQGDSSPQDWTILNGEYNVKGTTNTWKQMQIYSKEGSRASSKSSTALLDLEIGETYTLSFQGICYSGSPNVWVSLRANRTAPGNPEIMNGNFTLTSSWQTYQVTIPALTKPDNFDFWRIILGYSEIGHVAFRKVELTRSSTRIDVGPAPEDGKTDLVVAKSEFQKTADGLSAKLATVENYVGQDGQRQEALRRYTREESAKQATSVRELVTRDYVGKSAYQEDVRGIERRLEAITNPQNGSIATQIAKYKTAVDGRFADITSMISGKANQTDFQRVRETSQLYERILGNTENGIADKVARMALTSQLFQVEVSKASASGRNLFLNSLFKRDLRDKYSTYKLFDDASQTKGQLAVSIDSDNQFRGVNTLKIVSTFNGKTDNQKITFSLGGNSRTGRVDELKNKSARFSFWAKSTVNNTNFQARAGYRGAVKSVSLTTDWQFYDVEFIRNENTNATSELILHVFSNATVWIAFPKVEIGTVSTLFSEAPEDTDEAIRSVQSQLAGSWAVQNLTNAGSIVSQINATNNQILIEAEKIRLKGKTLLDELTAIQGYFKRLFVGDASVGTLNSDIIRSNSITADKLVMDMAMARRFVSSDIFTDTLAAKEAFINKLRSVVVTATLLEGFQGLIGGFRFGQYTNRNGYFITGTNSVSVGMGNGMNAGANRNAFWANWGESLDTPGPKAWYVNTDGKMYCRNEATFHSKVDFSSISNPNFYSKIKAHKGVWVGTDDVNGEGDNPAGGYNAVVWWSQIVTGKFRQHAGITTGSDRKLKENIEPTPVKALDKINALNLVAFDYIKDKTHEEIGLIAQEVLNIIPSSVEKYEDEDNHLTINYSKFVPYLIKAIQELNQKIEKMEKTIA